MTDKIALDDFRNPDRQPTPEQVMDDIMAVFREELHPILGEGALMEQVRVVLHPLVAELMSSVAHVIADEIADRIGHTASVHEHLHDDAVAFHYRIAEEIARTHIETAGGDVAGQ